MNKYVQVGLVSLLLLTGVLLTFTQVDREFINLRPSEGIANGIILEADTTYTQSFTATRRSLTRLGISLRPLTNNLPAEAITFIIHRNGHQVTTEALPAPFISSEGPSTVRFSPPLTVAHGDTIALTVVIPDALSGKVRVQTRELDDTFDPSNTHFTINDTAQPAPLAYQAYYAYRPPLAMQGGAAVIVGSLVWLGFSWRPRAVKQWLPYGYAIVVPAIAILPALLLGHLPLALIGGFILASLSMTVLTRHYFASHLPAQLLAISLFTLTTYYALHAADDRTKLLGLAALPLLFSFSATSTTLSSAEKILRNLLLVIAAGFVLFGSWNPAPDLFPPAHPRDIFLDPYQVPTSQKVTPPVSWSHYGSYVGPIALALALLGAVTRPRPAALTIGTLLLGTLLYACQLLFPATQSWGIPYSIIVVTFSLSLLAGHGLQATHHYLGFDRLVTVCMYIITFIVLFDLLQVNASVLEHGLL